MSQNFASTPLFLSNNYRRSIAPILLSILFLFSSCVANRMVPFDLDALNMGKEIKTEALNLMGLAGQDYSASASKVTAFKNKVNSHIEYESARGEKNQTTVDMWKLLMKPDGNLLGGFLTKWKNEGKMNPVLVSQFKNEVGKNLDKILSLENKKSK